MPETRDDAGDSERRDWDLPPMDAGDVPREGKAAPPPASPLDRPRDADDAHDSERRDWDLP